MRGYVASSRTVLTAILFGALAVRLAIVGIAVVRHATDSPDSQTYLRPAHALTTIGRFEQDGTPEIIRTPGYPLLIAMGDAVGHPRGVTLGIQVGLGVLTVWLVWVLGRTAGFSERAALAAAALYALEPLAIIFTARIMTETLFACTISALALMLARWVRGGRRADLIAAALLIALGGFVRPVLYYAPIVVAGVVAAMRMRRGAWRQALVDAFLVMAVAALPMLAWRIRNVAVAGYHGFSGVTDLSLRFYRAAGVVARRTQTPLEAVQASWGWGMVCDSLVANEYFARGRECAERLRGYRAAAIPILAQDPGAVVQDAAKGGLTTLIGPGVADWVDVLGLPRGRPLILTACLALYLACLWGLALLGLWKSRRELIAFVPALVLAAYLIVVTAGPEAYSRFRHPVMPVLCVLGGVGLARRRGSVVLAKTTPAEA